MKKIIVSISLLVGVCFFLPNEVTPEIHKYTPSVLFTLIYGTGDDQIGMRIPRLDEPSAGPTGPSEFWIDDKGNIYIADEWNGKIKKFSQDGKLLVITEGKVSVYPFAVDSEGNIFTGGDNIITKFDKNGKIVERSRERYFYMVIGDVIAKCDIDGKVVEYLKDLSVEEAKKGTLKMPIPDFTKLYYELKNLRPKMLCQIMKEEGPIANDQINIHTGLVKAKPFKYDKTTSKQFLDIYGSDKTTPIKRVPIFDGKGIYEGARGVSNWMVDEKGNLYAESHVDRISPIKLRKGYWFDIDVDILAYKYSSEGNLLGYIRCFGPPITGLRDWVKIDQAGNIYTLRFHADRMEVVKYEWVEQSKEPAPKQIKEGTQTIIEVPKVKNIEIGK